MRRERRKRPIPPGASGVGPASRAGPGGDPFAPLHPGRLPAGAIDERPSGAEEGPGASPGWGRGAGGLACCAARLAAPTPREGGGAGGRFFFLLLLLLASPA